MIDMTIPIHHLGFDFDGVIADTAETFIRIACERYGYCSFSRDDITSFELEDCLQLPYRIIEEIFTDILTDSIATELQPIKGAVETLECFTKHATVTIITARSLEQPVQDWLERFYSDDARKNIKVVATGDHDDKLKYIHQHDLRYFIDDRAETCEVLARENITPFVYSQPWNREKHTLQTVNNWAEIRALVQE